MMGLILILFAIPLVAVPVAAGLALKDRLGWAWYATLCIFSAAPGLFLLGTFVLSPNYWGSASMQVGLSAVFFFPVALVAVLMLLIPLAEEAWLRLRGARRLNP
jgi:hypothetical protein